MLNYIYIYIYNFNAIMKVDGVTFLFFRAHLSLFVVFYVHIMTVNCVQKLDHVPQVCDDE